jgi:hypothetical protein
MNLFLNSIAARSINGKMVFVKSVDRGRFQIQNYSVEAQKIPMKSSKLL